MTTDPQKPYSDDLRDFMFSNPNNTVPLDTLEFRHPAFVDADDNPVAVRVVNDPDDLTATLEAGAPMNAGEEVTFVACRFEVTLPESNSPGLPTCQIAVDNVGQVLMEQIEAAVQIAAPIAITYRQFLSTATDEPGVVIDGLTIRKINANSLRITATAGFEDDLNSPFGRKKYTRVEYPGLAR